MRQPPPGHTITPTPFGLAGLNTLSVGSDTLRSIAPSPAVPIGPRNVTSGPTPSSLEGGPSGQRRITSSGRSSVIAGTFKPFGASHLPSPARQPLPPSLQPLHSGMPATLPT